MTLRHELSRGSKRSLDSSGSSTCTGHVQVLNPALEERKRGAGEEVEEDHDGRTKQTVSRSKMSCTYSCCHGYPHNQPSTAPSIQCHLGVACMHPSIRGSRVSDNTTSIIRLRTHKFSR